MAENQVGRYRIVAIGGSAGSLDVILRIVGNPKLPRTLTYIIIIHRKNDPSSILSDLVTARTHLPVKEVEDKESIRNGTIYIAPPDYHLLIESAKEFSLDSSEKIHHSRPSIDVSFESIADTFREQVIGILLSGANADGAEGLKKIRDSGGCTIVQDPETSDVSYMPKQAIQLGAAELVLTADEMVDELIRRVGLG